MKARAVLAALLLTAMIGFVGCGGGGAATPKDDKGATGDKKTSQLNRTPPAVVDNSMTLVTLNVPNMT